MEISDQIIAGAILLVSAIAVGFAYKYHLKDNEVSTLKVKIGEMELEKSQQINREETEAHFSGRSDNDVIDEAIERGNKMPKS